MTAPRVVASVFMLSAVMSSPLHAQWLKQPTPGIPRTPAGQPNLSAPAPRAADGKPDLSGVWGFDGGASFFYIAGGLKPEEIRPAATEAVKHQADNFGRDDAFARCLPEGPRFNHFLGLPKKIVQTPALIVVLGEDLSYRQIFLDGRALPVDPSPSFMGYSVGRWDGDWLVVETTGYKDATKLDMAGHPHTENLRLTERYRRIDFGHIEIEETFVDQELYARPLTATVKATLVPDTDLLEYVCTENERDRRGDRLIGTATEARKTIVPASVPGGVLAQYVGLYDFRWPENPTIPSLWPVTLTNGQLFLHGAPLTPLSDTRFVWADANRLEFVQDAQGRVTHFVMTWVEGDFIVRRVAGK